MTTSDTPSSFDWREWGLCIRPPFIHSNGQMDGAFGGYGMRLFTKPRTAPSAFPARTATSGSLWRRTLSVSKDAGVAGEQGGRWSTRSRGALAERFPIVCVAEGLPLVSHRMRRPTGTSHGLSALDRQLTRDEARRVRP